MAEKIKISGWKKYAALFLLGALMTLSLPPLGFFPVLFLCLPALMILTAQSSTRGGAFLSGWAFGSGYLMASFYWTAVAFEHFLAYMMWLLPAAVIGMPVYMALYHGAAACLAWSFRGRKIYGLAFAVFMFWAEYLRGHYFTHFPWSLIGYGWDAVPALLQTCAVIGIYGLTFLTVFWAAMPLFWRESRYVAGLCLGTLLVALALGGAYLQKNPTALHETVTVRVVQPNISQAEKVDPAAYKGHFEKHLSLSAQAGSFTYLVWPETAFDMISTQETDHLARIAALLPPAAHALLGVNRMEMQGEAPPDVHNSLIAVNGRGETIATHDKFTLAPWGEQIPYQEFLRKTPIYSIFLDMKPLVAGKGPVTIRLGDLPSFSPIICFESTFPGEVTDKNDRPDFLLVQTNDAWSMGTAGPAQHFGFGRVRAIEEGLPIIRAANTGISAVIDPQGRILKQLPLDVAGILDHPLPKPSTQTFYGKNGDKPLLVFMALLTLLICLIGARSKKSI